MKVSVLLLTIDRYDLTREYVGAAIKSAGIPFDLCITDNGSTDPNIFKWCEDQKPTLYIKNGKNAGTAQSLNVMIARNPSDYYCFIGNDIKLPDNWLKKLVKAAEIIPDSGVIGIDWRCKDYKESEINGVKIWQSTSVFGTMFVSQNLRDKVGKFCEDYGPYGLWDGDYSLRAKAAGFINYYLHGERSHHFGNDVGSNSPYRKMKDESLSKAKPIFAANKQKYERGDYYL